jgi:hypothetical protein
MKEPQYEFEEIEHWITFRYEKDEAHFKKEKKQ